MRSFVAIVFAVVLLASPAFAESDKPMRLSAEVALLLAPNGAVLYAKNPSEGHAPASLVKLMTLYLACEDLETGRAQWDGMVTISRRAAETPRYRMGLRAGEEVPFRTLLEGVAIASANDAATAVSEYLGGSEEAFVERMNAKASELGLASTHFANAHGLPDPGQRSTAQDMARLIGRLVQDYPASRPLLGGASFVYRGRVHSRRIPLFQDPGGVQALKTGFTREAGYNLAIAAWREGQRFLLIVMGAQTRSLSFRDAKQLLRYGFVESGFEAPEEPRKPAPAPARRNNDRRRHASVSIKQLPSPR
ncbi:MAG TPA: D-alanyl-D-alanine carboxypeptidase family protein [Candidatus Bathyarchaeia archaeon]|nr:D-alanyl-D-alanine carboxypeptidase family protein [Candidatus Bathyarchaeia archaeon]